MLICKNTEGYVEQIFDTEKGKFVSQRFVAGDVCNYVDDDNKQVCPPAIMMQTYLPFVMVPPDVMFPENIGDDFCSECGRPKLRKYPY